jgi:tetratricopeptide (TPR) repeat protein
VKVPFRIRKRPEAAPATGFFLPGTDTARLLALCAFAQQTGRLVPPVSSEVKTAGASPAARSTCAVRSIHAVAGGFLAVLTQPTSAALPGAVRLRRLVPNLFLPADADLEPDLLDDEAAGLVRERGLLFLPGGRVLEFDPDRPVPLASLVRPGPIRRRDWRSLPEGPVQAEKLREVLLTPQGETADVIVGEGGEGIAEEEPRPEGTGPLTNAAAALGAGLGKGLVWLGNLLRWRGLARVGANLVRAAAERVPRLLEDVLGRQETALRQLLKDFRDGNLDRALRRALPLGGPGGSRGSVPSQHAILPTHNPRFSLRDLLANGSGPASIWYGGLDVQELLAEEYRKAAQEAARRGDHRRAAFIYAKLLQQHRLAADALMRGGFYHEAAVVYLEKLNDVLTAGRAFESACEFDRAIELYRSRSAHLQAGDLLRKIGEEEQALEEYLLAARELVRQQGDYLAAGNLLLERACHSDLALDYFRTGWQRRPAGSPVPCLLRLLELTAPDRERGPFREAVASAREYFARHGSDTEAAAFCNALVPLAQSHFPAAEAEDFRDCALVGLAERLRIRAGAETRPGTVVSALLGQSSLWPAAVVNDAEVAFKAALREPRSAGHSTCHPALQLGDGQILSACCAPQTGRVFVGFEDGQMAEFDSMTGRRCRLLGPSRASVRATATDLDGRFFLAITAEGDAREITSSEDEGHDHRHDLWRRRVLSEPAEGLSPVQWGGAEPAYAAWDERRIQFLVGRHMVAIGELTANEIGCGSIRDVHLVGVRSGGGISEGCVVFDDTDLYWCPRFRPPARSVPLEWASAPRKSCLNPQTVLLQSLSDRLLISVLRVREGGRVHLYRVLLADDKPGPARRFDGLDEGYLAAALVGPDRVAAVRRDGVHWLRPTLHGLPRVSMTAAPLPEIVACFHSLLTAELLLLTHDGWLLRVPVPQ